MKHYSTKKSESTLGMVKWAGLILIIIGLFQFLTKDSSTSISGFWYNLDGLITPLIGLVLFVFSNIQLNKIKDSFILFKDKKVSFKSRKKSMAEKSMADFNYVNINLKTIDIETKEGELFTFYLEDYNDFKSKKAIKEAFGQIKTTA